MQWRRLNNFIWHQSHWDLLLNDQYCSLDPNKIPYHHLSLSTTLLFDHLSCLYLFLFCLSLWLNTYYIDNHFQWFLNDKIRKIVLCKDPLIWDIVDHYIQHSWKMNSIKQCIPIRSFLNRYSLIYYSSWRSYFLWRKPLLWKRHLSQTSIHQI